METSWFPSAEYVTCYIISRERSTSVVAREKRRCTKTYRQRKCRTGKHAVRDRYLFFLVSSCQAGPKVVCIVSFMGRTMSVNLLMRQFRPTRGSAVQPEYRTPFGFSEIWTSCWKTVFYWSRHHSLLYSRTRTPFRGFRRFILGGVVVNGGHHPDHWSWVSWPNVAYNI